MIDTGDEGPRHRAALVEIEDIFAYLSTRNPIAAKAVVARVDEKIAKLANFL